jgi:hypothetical protein
LSKTGRNRWKEQAKGNDWEQSRTAVASATFEVLTAKLWRFKPSGLSNRVNWRLPIFRRTAVPPSSGSNSSLLFDYLTLKMAALCSFDMSVTTSQHSVRF